ncbi:crossover junction endodeoxyribonuclease RuvC [Alphaproteobacteria bacterium]|nr:crossover junction endodeoxyribonuclease RuvC [Alphaproteobacteria bacterium]
MRILGLDPGLQRTGWGVIAKDGSRLAYVASGVVASNKDALLAARLAQLFAGINEVLAAYSPAHASIEETFVNANPRSALKLGHARGVALLAPALAGVSVFEYTPNQIKKTIVGNGHADKAQVAAMVKILLGGKVEAKAGDASDALAAAICHAHQWRNPA